MFYFCVVNVQNLISLCEHAGEKEKAVIVFDRYVSQAENQLKPDQFLKLLKQNANYKMTRRFFKFDSSPILTFSEKLRQHLIKS